MKNLSLAFRIISALTLFAGMILYFLGYNNAAINLTIIAIFFTLFVLGLQISKFYHNHFLQRRRQ